MTKQSRGFLAIPFRTTLLGLMLFRCALISANADQVFQCRDASGKVTYSNTPCNLKSTQTPSEDGTSDYGSIYGEWRGQTQFKETVSGGSDRLSHLITPLTLRIEPGGKVTGASQDSGCRILGLARPGPVATEPSLDLTVSSCKDRVFNRRYTGSLALYTRQKYATLQLISLPPPLFGKPATYDISATLKR
jgi:Domain of unknown function (DUF4124)